MAVEGNTEVWGKGTARFGQMLWVLGVAGFASLMLAACASLGGVSKESPLEVKQAAVTERAKARWQAVVDGKADVAYGFLSPGSKAVTTLENYKARARLAGFRAADIESVACETELCRVKVRVTLDHRLMKGLSVPAEETWILEKGQYWYVWQL